MNKFGVDTGNKPEDLIKTGADKMKCPICGAELDPDSNVPKCPVHGTEPFERRTHDKQEG